MKLPLPEGPLNRALVILLAVAVLGTAGYFGYGVWTDDSCATGVSKVGKECVGVTDGSYVFNDDLGPVTARIKEENDSVAGKNPVTLALMIPLVSDQQAERREMVEQVQGAYLAQYRANRESGKQPPIRLVLANPGREYGQWQRVSDQLAKAAADGKQNLRAVTGINISIANSEAAVHYLTAEKHIPVVAGPMTADDIANSKADPRHYPGLARIAPSNSDQAAALAAYGAGIKPADTLVVEDTRENDNYLATLRATFAKLTKGAPNAPETFESPKDFTEEGNLGNTFDQMVPDICSSAATTLFFAGRPVQLRLFLVALGDRKCNKPYTVITGSHASTLMVDQKFESKWDALTKSAGITVRYTALAHPDSWGEASTEGPGGSKAPTAELAGLLRADDTKQPDRIGPADRRDGRIIITYDAVTTAVAGIRKDVGGSVVMPSLDDVTQSWRRLHGGNRVDGASGWICLDQFGNPYNKAVPIVHLDATVRGAVLDTVAWPLGRAPDGNCSIGAEG
nr:ABC transporter substrate-binding protein [Kitasatospora purpeofusca]